MAKNWTVAEATKVVREGKNKADIMDITKRFPLFALAVKTEAGIVEMLKAAPEAFTARRFDTALREASGVSEDAETSEEVVETESKPVEKKTVEKKPAEKKASSKKGTKKAEAEDEYSGKTAKELYSLCKERGLKVEAKRSEAVYIKALKKDDAAKVAEASEEDDDWDEEEKPEKPEKAKKKAKTEDEDDDDDWDIE